MRQLLAVFLLFAGLSALGADTATSLKGYLLDVACHDRLKPKGHLNLSAALHSRSCLEAPFCTRSGFGVLTDDQHFIKFDDDGNAKVKKFIAGFNRETDIKIIVTGTVAGDKMTVSKIELQQ